MDGFYEAVIQQLRPWTPRAPQLPKGIRSAAEEAGLDLSPPPLDLVEAGETIEPSDIEPGGGLTDEATKRATDEGSDEDSPSLPAEDEGDVVVWHRAEERLDRERAPDDEDSSSSDLRS